MLLSNPISFGQYRPFKFLQQLPVAIPAINCSVMSTREYFLAVCRCGDAVKHFPDVCKRVLLRAIGTFRTRVRFELCKEPHSSILASGEKLLAIVAPGERGNRRGMLVDDDFLFSRF